MNWYFEALKKYLVVDGRARRKEYWYFILFNLIIIMVLATVDYTIGTFDPATGTGVLSGLYSLFILIPSITVGVRRLHDTGNTGWWLLVSLVPLIGTLILLYFFVQPSDKGSNKYGKNPVKRGT